VKKIVPLIVSTLLWTCSCSYQNPIIEWEGGIIPYYYTGSFTSGEIILIEEGMKKWESVCGVKFVVVTPGAYAYEIRKIMGTQTWTSSVGENNVSCFLNYGYSTAPMRHIVHELGHCLGFLHEHQRPGRDSYITIMWNNIYPEYEFDFEIRNNPLITEENYTYDYNSVMHYPKDAFSINGYDTILPADSNAVIGVTEDISPLDAEKAREIYGPPREDDDF
jgi:hypothetical protein